MKLVLFNRLNEITDIKEANDFIITEDTITYFDTEEGEITIHGYVDCVLLPDGYDVKDKTYEQLKADDIKDVTIDDETAMELAIVELYEKLEGQ